MGSKTCFQPDNFFFFFQGMSCIFQQDKAKLLVSFITTAWLYSGRLQVLNCSAFSSDGSPAADIWCRKKTCLPKAQGCLTEKILHQTLNGTTFQNSKNWRRRCSRRRGTSPQWQTRPTLKIPSPIGTVS